MIYVGLMALRAIQQPAAGNCANGASAVHSAQTPAGVKAAMLVHRSLLPANPEGLGSY
jgi:hypothetical protein